MGPRPRNPAPARCYTYPVDQHLRLWASITPSLGADEAEEAVWTVDGDEVGHGLDTWSALEEGEHRIGVNVAGADATVTVTATAVRPE